MREVRPVDQRFCVGRKLDAHGMVVSEPGEREEF
jgi:hypothetical protein